MGKFIKGGGSTSVGAVKAAYPANASTTGDKGGMPGYKGANGGNARPVGNLHKGHAQSGHDGKATTRAGTTGYGGKGKC